ncbi:PREDICTED: uveal autoantigen with coiled-coil domains and ankyrin repeats-like [Diuraphis noxia]|uniref:uveal autoantigen with coiled-coil domains and ankyrin repeats-like n=1 Tax=Diuraphis noxia TaxID=143948 RepID=UPI0007637F87|nr:PREDICTED: uveal autoantigen with coiled-coil domains and ankyrin repeats-like [Diuraphis noxia]
MDLLYNPKLSPLYKDAYFYEEPTHQEIIMRKMRIDKLKYKHMHLHATMLNKINMFDDHLFELNKMRIDIKLEIKFLDLWATTLEEEMLVLYDFDLLEDELSYKVHVKIGLQNDKAQQIQRIQEDIKYFNDIHIKETNMLIDNRHNFDMCMKLENNGFAKHLKKIFDKKLKIPKIKSHDTDDSSSSSSDESDESEPEYNNESGESLMAMKVPTVFDEKVLPLGCDPKLFDKTLELRSKKYEIEKNIEDIKKKLDASRTHLSLAYVELNVIEDELKQTQNELESCQIKKQLKLNDVYTTIVLHKSQMTKAKSLKNSILLYGNVIQDLSNRAAELKKEEKEVINNLANEKLCAKKDRIEIAKMENVLKNIKISIKDEMIKKFKTETNWKFLDEMEMTIIDYMIIKSKSESQNLKNHFIQEIRILENQIRSQQKTVTDLLKSNTRKNKLLKNVLENINIIRQYLDVDQERITKKFQNLAMESTFTTEISTMNCIYDILVQKKEYLCEQICTHKLKCKMLAPIVQQNSPKAIQSQAIEHSTIPATQQEESEELDLNTIKKR